MSQPTLLISDLHLDPSREAINRLFLSFLEEHRGQVAGLYILGDLFEAWLGDDAAHLVAPIIDGLKAFSTQTPLYVMHGNRDFLIGQRFCELTGATLLNDPFKLDLHGEPTLLMHGDSLCTDDLEYQRLRAQVRDPAWQEAILAKSLEERIAFARQARDQSSGRNQFLDDYLMDVNQKTVEDAMRQHRVRRLIHGHTHRPAVHHIELDGAPATRIVLGDWYEQGSVLRLRPEGPDLQTLAP